MTSIKLNQLSSEASELNNSECDKIAGGFLATAIAVVGGIGAILQGAQTIKNATSSTAQVAPNPVVNPTGVPDLTRQAAINGLFGVPT